jgi:hypothetical protein
MGPPRASVWGSPRVEAPRMITDERFPSFTGAAAVRYNRDRHETNRSGARNVRLADGDELRAPAAGRACGPATRGSATCGSPSRGSGGGYRTSAGGEPRVAAAAVDQTADLRARAGAGGADAVRGAVRVLPRTRRAGRRERSRSDAIGARGRRCSRQQDRSGRAPRTAGQGDAAVSGQRRGSRRARRLHSRCDGKGLDARRRPPVRLGRGSPDGERGGRTTVLRSAIAVSRCCSACSIPVRAGEREVRRRRGPPSP